MKIKNLKFRKKFIIYQKLKFSRFILRYCNKNKILLLKQKIKAKNIKNSIFLNIVFFFLQYASRNKFNL